MWFGGRRRGSCAKGSRVPEVRVDILLLMVRSFLLLYYSEITKGIRFQVSIINSGQQFTPVFSRISRVMICLSKRSGKLQMLTHP